MSYPRQSRVFILHHPEGGRCIGPDGKVQSNHEIAAEIAKAVCKNVEMGLPICITFPIAEAAYHDPSPQWSLREVQRVDEEEHEKLLEVAKRAVEIFKSIGLLKGGIRIPLSDDEVKRLGALREALHDAGYEWEELC